MPPQLLTLDFLPCVEDGGKGWSIYLSVVFWYIYKSTDYKVSAEAYNKISEFSL